MTPLPSCESIEVQLSAYIDNEIDESSRLNIDEHCVRCEKCRQLVWQHKYLGELMRQSELSVDTEAFWERVSTTLGVSETAKFSNKTDVKGWVYSVLATAVSVVLLWFVYMSYLTKDHHDAGSHEHTSLAVDFQEVVRLAKTDSRTAISKLALKYQGKELERDQAIEYLGYEPAIFRHIPSGFTHVSTHVLNMPCCKCSASICQRIDGTSLIVFEHNDEQPFWFGDSALIETQCSGKNCKLVESSGQLAVSWKNDNRQLTLIGATDISEVNLWVKQMEH